MTNSFSIVKNIAKHRTCDFVFGALNGANLEKDYPVTIYGGRSGALHVSNRKVSLNINNAALDAEMTFKQ